MWVWLNVRYSVLYVVYMLTIQKISASQNMCDSEYERNRLDNILNIYKFINYCKHIYINNYRFFQSHKLNFHASGQLGMGRSFGSPPLCQADSGTCDSTSLPIPDALWPMFASLPPLSSFLSHGDCTHALFSPFPLSLFLNGSKFKTKEHVAH